MNIAFDRNMQLRRRFHSRRPTGRDRAEELAKIFESFTASARPSISWHMNSTTRRVQTMRKGRKESEVAVRDCYNSAYACSITWTPGTLTLAGDIGELVITHYSAMPTIEATLNWLRGADHDYLMGKSSAKQEFDGEGTAAHLIESANEQAFDAAWAWREEMRDWRKDFAQAVADWDEQHDGAFGPPQPNSLPDRPEHPQVTRNEHQVRRFGRPAKEYEPPDGWELWHAIHQRLDAFGDPNDIFTTAGRQRLKEGIEAMLDDGHHAAVEFCGKIGFDDYYGSEKWPSQTYLQFAAIKHWVKLADAEVFPAKAEISHG